jgi:hypothetical protein
MAVLAVLAVTASALMETGGFDVKGGWFMINSFGSTIASALGIVVSMFLVNWATPLAG